jgi:hypothetical protein
LKWLNESVERDAVLAEDLPSDQAHRIAWDAEANGDDFRHRDFVSDAADVYHGDVSFDLYQLAA